MGQVLTGVADTILPLAQKALPLVENVATAMLPETAGIFKSVSELLGSVSTPTSQSSQEKHEALKLIDSLDATPPRKRQGKMLQVLELLLDELDS